MYDNPAVGFHRLKVGEHRWLVWVTCSHQVEGTSRVIGTLVYVDWDHVPLLVAAHGGGLRLTQKVNIEAALSDACHPTKMAAAAPQGWDTPVLPLYGSTSRDDRLACPWGCEPLRDLVSRSPKEGCMCPGHMPDRPPENKGGLANARLLDQMDREIDSPGNQCMAGKHTCFSVLGKADTFLTVPADRAEDWRTGLEFMVGGGH